MKLKNQQKKCCKPKNRRSISVLRFNRRSTSKPRKIAGKLRKKTKRRSLKGTKSAAVFKTYGCFVPKK